MVSYISFTEKYVLFSHDWPELHYDNVCVCQKLSMTTDVKIMTKVMSQRTHFDGDFDYEAVTMTMQIQAVPPRLPLVGCHDAKQLDAALSLQQQRYALTSEVRVEPHKKIGELDIYQNS